MGSFIWHNLMAADIIKPRDPLLAQSIPNCKKLDFGHILRIAIDGTHIPVTVPLHDQPKYFGHHGYASQNVMAVCDFDIRFTFVVTGWAGSVHDAWVLLDTLVTYKEEFPFPPEEVLSR